MKKLFFEKWEWEFMENREHGVYLALLHIPFFIAIMSAHALIRQQIWGFSGFLLFFLTCSYLLWVFGYRKLYCYFFLFSGIYFVCGFFSLFHADWVVYTLWLLLMYGGIKFSPIVFLHQNMRQDYHQKLWNQYIELINQSEHSPLYDELNGIKTLNETDRFYAGEIIWQTPEWVKTINNKVLVKKGIVHLVYLMIQRAMKNKTPIKISITTATGKKADKTGNIRMDWEFDPQDVLFDEENGIYTGYKELKSLIQNKQLSCVLVKGFRNGKYVIRLGFFTQ